MKKLLVVIALFTSFFVNAQELNKQVVINLLEKNKESIGLSILDIENSIITNAYKSPSSGLTFIYLQQSHNGLPIFNQLKTIVFKDEKLVSNEGFRIENIDVLTKQIRVFPTVTPTDALITALKAHNILIPSTLNATTVTPGRKYNFGKANIATENITAELLWVPLNDANEVKLAWQIYLVPKSTSDYWVIRVDAHENQIINKNNLTVFCDWESNKTESRKLWERNNFILANKQNKPSQLDASIFGLNEFLNTTNSSPAIVNSATYRVIKLPAESPIHPGGTPQLVTNPWTAAPGNATSLKWHSTGNTDYNYTRGNNVWAREDNGGSNTAGNPATSTTPSDPLSFDFTPDFTLSPTINAAVSNQSFNITNLFYWNNIFHDVLYLYGFDEVSGNFQSNNQGRGGAGNDYVLADAQDGSGTNNANFSAPSDGASGRMQMYLWNSIPSLRVNTPASIAGQYQAIESNFSTANKLINVGPRTAQVVYYNDNAAGTTHEGCLGVPTNTVLGKIALIDRGNCNFTIKVKNAQDAGAIGVIMVNNVQGAPITMGGTDNTITIPAVMVTLNDGLILKNQLSNILNVTLAVGPSIDGDVDNGVICHEHAHGLSIRLTGGAANSSCLSNAEQMGEGWSDYYGLMLTQDWATANLNTGSFPRGIGTYVVGQTPSQIGIRSQQYCTEFDINNKVYASTIPTAVHDIGEIWCATIWDMTWNIINQTGIINPNIYDVNSTGGNNIAMRLVTEGMKIQPCSPGFIDGRNAILKADSLLYGGIHTCPIKEAFRRRGMGEKATQGSSGSVTDQVADYTPFIKLSKTQSISEALEGQSITYTSAVSSCSPLTGYVLRDTLATNVTYVSGGTYDAANRVVSFPVSFASAQTQSYSYVVSVNPGSYFTPVTLLDEQLTGTSIPSTLTASSTTANTWTVSNVQSQSAPNALFTNNAATASDQKLETTNAIALGNGTSSLSFYHSFNTQSKTDGGLVEISTNNGTTWLDLTNRITNGYYNSLLGTTGANPLANRNAWSGNSGGFIKSSINLSSYASQSVKLRFRFGSNSTVGGNGWFVDDVLLKQEPVVNIRSSLFDGSSTRINYADTVTTIVQTVTCTNVAVNAQPNNITACEGSPVSFSVVANGTSPVYQWQVSIDGGTNFTDISGATTSSLVLNAVTSSMENYRYRVQISNACPSTATSTSAILHVGLPAEIVNQPTGVTACVGTNANFSVEANGNPNTYQWQVSTDGGVNFTDITGAIGNAYTLSNATAAQTGNKYRVVISSCSTLPVISNPATLTVSNLATIATQPNNVNACIGGNATISVIASGSELIYQWQVSTDGGVTYNDISGATSSSVLINGITNAFNNNQYRVKISNNCASNVTSETATLLVSEPATITSQPLNQTICEGTNINFAVTTAGNNVSYQWQVSTDGGISFTNITGATNASYQLNSVSPSLNNNLYRAVVFSCSAVGLNSATALLNVTSLPSILTAPSNTTACVGNAAVFGIEATGDNVQYQWQMSTDGGITFNDISGATAASITINNVGLSLNNYLIRVLLSNTCSASVLSPAATLTVNAQASIVSNPSNQTACPGNTASFNAVATGPDLSYQWQMSADNGATFTDISGATSSSFNITNVTASMNNNQYRVKLLTSCSANSISTNTAVLTVLPQANILTNPSDFSGCAGSDASFSISAEGTNVQYQWQVSTDNGASYTNINGATNNTLLLSSITTNMNNNIYRAIVSATPCGNISTTATLNISASPIVNIQASPYKNLFPGLSTTLTASSIPASTSFNWYKNGNLISGVSGNTLTVDFDGRGTYTAKALSECNNISNTLIIGDSATSSMFIYPNPNNGQFYIQFFGTDQSQSGKITMFDSKGARVFSQTFNLTSAYEKIEVIAKKLAAGTYLIMITDNKGNKINSGKLVKQ
jgi:hypothetical protein